MNILLGEDEDSLAAWDNSEYDPANLGPDGYTGSGVPCAAIGVHKAMLQVGGTVRVQWIVSTATEAYPFTVTRDDGSYYLNLRADSVSGELQIEGGQSLDVTYEAEVNNSGLNVIAITTTPTRFEFAVNGLPAHAPDVSAELPVGGWLIFLFQAFSAGSSMQSVTIYDPLPDTTGLSELSDG